MTIRLPKTDLGRVALIACSLALAQSYPASAQQLPPDVPIPEQRPADEAQPSVVVDQPDTQILPAAPPVPAERPNIAPEKSPGKGSINELPLKDSDELATTPPELSKPSKEELACREDLRKLGAVFKETQITATNGCSLPFPIEVSTLATGTDVVAPVTVSCTTALASGKFVREVIQPAAQKTFGVSVKSIAQASGYVCRPRNGTRKLSEHAFGNALDIASFTLANDQVVEVKPAPPEKDQRFLTEVRSAACGPFKTVLGPGSNADHDLHLHFDLAQRRNGSTYCK